MGKTLEYATFWNVLDEERVKSGEIQPLNVECQIDNGATTVVLPEGVASQLGLMKNGKTKVRYADERIEEREVVIGLRIRLMGRDTVCRAVVEPNRKIPLVGQIVLEDLDLWIDSKAGRLVPNPESPDSPLLDIL